MIIQWDQKNSVLYLGRCLEKKNQILDSNTWVINFLGDITELIINMYDFEYCGQQSLQWKMDA